jgi:hypothetical protein
MQRRFRYFIIGIHIILLLNRKLLHLMYFLITDNAVAIVRSANRVEKSHISSFRTSIKDTHNAFA